MDGWIKLHRTIQSNPFWHSEPFSRGQAWVDLLLLANHKESFFYKRGNKVIVKRGQVGRSEVELSDRWKWSRTKVRKFLKDLEKEQQIEIMKSRITQVLTIVNYDFYQEEEQQKDNRKTAEEQQKDTYKNEKNNITTNIGTDKAREIIFDKFGGVQNAVKNVAEQYKLETGFDVPPITIQTAIASFLQKGMIEYYTNLTRPEQVISKLMQWITNAVRNDRHDSKPKKKEKTLDYEKYIIECWYKEKPNPKKHIEYVKNKGILKKLVADFNSKIDELQQIHNKEFSNFPNLSICTIYDVLYTPLGQTVRGDTKTKKIATLKTFIASLSDYLQNKGSIRYELVKSKEKQHS